MEGLRLWTRPSFVTFPHKGDSTVHLAERWRKEGRTKAGAGL
jgi:hypothetical protein